MTARNRAPRHAQSRPAALEERFDAEVRPGADGRTLDARLAPTLTPSASLIWTPGGLRLATEPATTRAYSNAQLDDFHDLRPRDYPWSPPVTLRIRARASRAAWPARDGANLAGVSGSYLTGTAGFGFWNGSPSITGGAFRLPESVWFFAASPPSNMALTPGVPGYGWKAQVVHSQRPGALAAAPPLAAAALWARLTGDERAAARWLNRLTGAREVALDPDSASLRDWHEYVIEWRADSARFLVDGQDVLMVSDPPRGPLGFVTWVDNQFAVATPRGQLRFGALASDAQWLELAYVSIQPQ